MRNVPIGLQNIQEIITDGYIYVDKTQFALNLIQTGKHYFLSRPRRFGKSLFVSTLEEIFKGNKALFEGCHIYESNYDWKPYPVLLLDFGDIANETTKELKADLSDALTKMGIEQSITVEGPSLQSQLKALIKALAKNGKVVVLIDEYDKPLIDNLHNQKIAEGNRRLLQSFFGALKSLDKHIKFTFITGISKFSKVSLFSGANHLKDISMDTRYAAMMGYTQEELIQCFDEHIQAIAQTRNRKGQAISEEEVLAEIKDWYNGYRFSEEEIYVYNPFSTLNYLDEKKANSYWFATGTPTFLVEELKKRPQEITALSQMLATQKDLSDISKITRITLPALLFQTGYLTIEDYDVKLKAYQLGFPNKEVREALFGAMLEELADGKVKLLEVSGMADKLLASLNDLELDTFIDIIKTHFARIDYHTYQHAKEGFYQAIFMICLELSGIHTQGEIATNKGRIDVLCQLAGQFYIFELKVDHKADKAMEQILNQEYSQICRHQGKQIVVIGISFSSKKRNIDTWQGELLDENGKLIRKLAPEAEK